jgi:hypothetical protein
MPADVPNAQATASVRAYPSGLLASDVMASANETPLGLFTDVAREIAPARNLYPGIFSMISLRKLNFS